MANRYDTNTKNTSKYMSDLLNEFIKMPRSSFNESRRKIFDASPYAIIPVECWEMLPNSEAYLSYDVQAIAKNPTIKRLLSSMSIELRTYRIDYNDCWEAWNNFITKGRSGTVTKSIPYLDYSLGTSGFTTSLPYNPCHYLSIAPAVHRYGLGEEWKKWSFELNQGVQNEGNTANSNLTGIGTLAKLKTSEAMKVSALPFVFYNKIAKQYQNSNLLQKNTHWYPENEEHDMILPYSVSGQAVTTSDYDNPTKSWENNKSIASPSADENSYPWLNVLQYAMRKGDYFNTGSPFPDLIRGDVPTLSALNAQVSGQTLDWTDALLNSTYTPNNAGSSSARVIAFVNDLARLGVLSNPSSQNLTNLGLFNSVPTDMGGSGSSAGWPAFRIDKNDQLKLALEKVKVSPALIDGVSFSMAQWRYLATMTVLKERMALTDGSYNQMIRAMFGHNPKWHSHEPTYCGGSRQQIVFSEVVQTSEDGNSPLGTTAGRAVSAQQNNRIHVQSDDFGMFMTVMVIIPDEYYSQGVDKMWSRLENAEQYLPILNNLSPDATQNRELYVSGDNDIDMDVFNYQERFAYYKSRRNQVSGLMALPISDIGDTGAYVQNRLFGSTPEFNYEFTQGKLSDNEKLIWASTDQAQFACVVSSSMTYIGPIPEDSRPSDMGISY